MFVRSLHRIAVPATLIVIAACGGGGTGDGTADLFRMEEEPIGDNCFQGGVALMFGEDDNGNGLLDEGEVDSTEYICNGTGAHATLVDALFEEAGEFCPEGGIAIHTGVDLNDDGELQLGEVTSTEYICNGRPGSGFNSLVEVVEEPAGENCEGGGLAVQSGLDENGDGELQADEVTGTEYVCNGSAGSGLNSLIDVVEEPEGEHCEAGGLAIHSGLDLNGDGELQADEVATIEYVCNGTAGSGLNSLISTEDEPPGENCAGGGTAVQSGLDESGDGVLQPDEVDRTVYVCDGAGISSLVRLEDEEPGDNCEHGGQAMMTGMDLDGDGVLDADEVTTTAYVCNGERGDIGHASLFDTSDVPAGDDCLTGGVRISTGIDMDDDGELDADEITASEIVCDGEMGPSAPMPRVTVTDEPAGENCELGGQRIDAGVDLNGNGTLDDIEIDTTDYVCDAAGDDALVTATEVPAGDDCAAGGLRIDSGLDDDGDGVLDGGEIDDTEYLCNATSASTLIRVTRAAWGGVCPRGGVIVDTGMDEDGDGELGDDEVDESQYICNLYFVQVAGGFNHTCALGSDARVRCWGRNNYGYLGDGTDTTRYMPVLVEGLENVASIECGDMHTCALQTDGDVYCWGYNHYGQIGDGTRTHRWHPTHVSTIDNVEEISAGQNHTCARFASTGVVRCWGYNGHGQIGDATTTDRYNPVASIGISDAVSVSAGGNHTCIVTDGARVYCWGYNGYGQLGDATTTRRTSPVMVGVIDDAVSVTVGDNHSCALLDDGRGRCWGYNGYGQLGDASNTTRYSPVFINGLSTIAFITSGYNFTCAILEDETARCWGYNGHGELGDGTATSRNVPVEVIYEHESLHMSGGQYHTCSVQHDGRVFCWGYNGYGQIGDDTTTTTYEPTAVRFDDAL